MVKSKRKYFLNCDWLRPFPSNLGSAEHYTEARIARPQEVGNEIDRERGPAESL